MSIVQRDIWPAVLDVLIIAHWPGCVAEYEQGGTLWQEVQLHVRIVLGKGAIGSVIGPPVCVYRPPNHRRAHQHCRANFEPRPRADLADNRSANSSNPRPNHKAAMP